MTSFLGKPLVSPANMQQIDSGSPVVFDRLLAISRALAGHVDPAQAFRATAVEIETLIPHAHIDVGVLLDEGRSHACYEAGFDTSWSALAQCPLPTERSPVRAVFRGEVPYLLTGDALVDQRFHFEGALDEPIYTGRLRSRIVVPMRARGAIVGALNISRHEPDRFSEADVGVAQQCADFIAPYIFALSQADQARRAMLAESDARSREELLRVGASKLTEGMERERRRMAMDLHDQTLADLARVARQVSSLRNHGVARARAAGGAGRRDRQLPQGAAPHRRRHAPERARAVRPARRRRGAPQPQRRRRRATDRRAHRRHQRRARRRTVGDDAHGALPHRAGGDQQRRPARGAGQHRRPHRRRRRHAARQRRRRRARLRRGRSCALRRPRSHAHARRPDRRAAAHRAAIRPVAARGSWSRSISPPASRRRRSRPLRAGRPDGDAFAAGR